MLVDEAQKGGSRYLACFPQSPTGSLLNQAVFVGEKLLNDAKCFFGFAVPDECKRRYDGDAALPHNWGPGKLMEHIPSECP